MAALGDVDGLLHIFFPGAVVFPSAQEAGDLSALVADPEFHGLGGVAQGDPDHKGRPLSLFAGHGDGAVVAQDGALGDGKAQAGAADLSGSGLVDPVESLEDPGLGVLGDPDAVVLDSQFKVLVVGVDGDDDPAVLAVVFDGVFHQVGQDLADPDGVHLGKDLPLVDQGQLDIPELGDGAEPLHDGLGQGVDIGPGDLKLDVGPVLLDQGQKVRDDLVLAVDLMVDILEEFPVDGGVHLLLGEEGGREDLHGGHGSLELVGDVGDEFLPGLVQGVHAAQHVVEGVGDMHGLDILGRADGLIGIALLDLPDISGEDLEGADQGAGDHDGREKDDDQHDGLQEEGLAPEDVLGLGDVLGGGTCQQDSPDRI